MIRYAGVLFVKVTPCISIEEGLSVMGDCQCFYPVFNIILVHFSSLLTRRKFELQLLSIISFVLHILVSIICNGYFKYTCLTSLSYNHRTVWSNSGSICTWIIIGSVLYFCLSTRWGHKDWVTGKKSRKLP